MNNFILPTIILTLVIGVIAKILQMIVFRTRSEELISEKDLDPRSTFYSVANHDSTKIFSFTDKGLLLIIRSSIIMPRLSLIDKQILVEYKDIVSVDLGQATLTIKFKNILSLETLLFRHNGGGVASLKDSKARTVITSKQTRSEFLTLLDKNSVPHNNVDSTKRSITSAIALGIIIPITLVCAIILLTVSR